MKRARCPISGTITGERGGKSRHANFEEAVQDYPLIFRVEDTLFKKLDVNVQLLESMLEAAGRECLAGSSEGWGVLWDLQAQLDIFADDSDREHLGETMILNEPTGDILSETINVAALEQSIRGQAGESTTTQGAFSVATLKKEIGGRTTRLLMSATSVNSKAHITHKAQACRVSADRSRKLR